MEGREVYNYISLNRNDFLMLQTYVLQRAHCHHGKERLVQQELFFFSTNAFLMKIDLDDRNIVKSVDVKKNVIL